MIVVLDTNLWLKELVLNSGIGSALRFFLNRQKARLALPEVVRLEVQHNLRGLILDAIDNVNTGNRRLLALFGSMKEIVLPSPQEVEAVISGVFSGLQVDVLDVPFSFDSAHASFMKTIHKLPPSDKTQEFKDGVLWADCVRLLDQDDVLFTRRHIEGINLAELSLPRLDTHLALYAENFRLNATTKRNLLDAESDMADIMYANYLPYVDILRVDTFAGQVCKSQAEMLGVELVLDIRQLPDVIRRVAESG